MTCSWRRKVLGPVHFCGVCGRCCCSGPNNCRSHSPANPFVAHRPAARAIWSVRVATPALHSGSRTLRSPAGIASQHCRRCDTYVAGPSNQEGCKRLCRRIWSLPLIDQMPMVSSLWGRQSPASCHAVVRYVQECTCDTDIECACNWYACLACITAACAGRGLILQHRRAVQPLVILLRRLCMQHLPAGC